MLSLLVVIANSCVSPYYPVITKYENLLVVDGELTNMPGPYKVKLSRSYSFTDFPTKVTGAAIKIIDDLGLEENLTEKSTGEYVTTDTTFRGIPGRSYKLQIKVNGEIYESDFEQIKQPVPIDKLYWEYNPEDTFGPNRIGVMVDSHDPDNKTRYYGWNYDETWKFKVPIDITLHPDWKICYRYNTNNYISLGTSIQLNNDAINRRLLLSVNESTNRLYIRYTMLAKQYSFSEQTYSYLEQLNKINLNQGSLFDPTPYSLAGNVRNVRDKEAPVLGYFLVAGVAEKRLFIDRTDLPKEYKPTDGFDDCSTESASVSSDLTDFRQDKLVDSLMNKGYAVYEQHVVLNSVTNEKYIQLYLAKPFCFNCTLQGDNKIPPFWTEK
jgi:hypothetical protein